jgi:hypothetical protein
MIHAENSESARCKRRSHQPIRGRRAHGLSVESDSGGSESQWTSACSTARLNRHLVPSRRFHRPSRHHIRCRRCQRPSRSRRFHTQGASRHSHRSSPTPRAVRPAIYLLVSWRSAPGVYRASGASSVEAAHLGMGEGDLQRMQFPPSRFARRSDASLRRRTNDASISSTRDGQESLETSSQHTKVGSYRHNGFHPSAARHVRGLGQSDRSNDGAQGCVAGWDRVGYPDDSVLHQSRRQEPERRAPCRTGKGQALAAATRRTAKGGVEKALGHHVVTSLLDA